MRKVSDCVPTMSAMPGSDTATPPTAYGALSASAALAAAAERAPLPLAVADPFRRRSSARMMDDVARLARGLVELGVRRGHRVAIVAGMRVETLEAVHAALRIGAVAVIHDPASSARELRRCFEDHAAIVAIAERGALGTLRDLPSDIRPKALIALDDPRSTADRMRGAVHAPLAMARHLRRHPLRRPPRPAEHHIPWRLVLESAPLPAAHAGPSPRDLALLQYTTGPDGTLMGAMLTHENLVATAQQALVALDAPDGAAVCSALPLHEPAGASIALLAPMLGSHPLVLVPGPEDAVAALRRGRPSVVAATPGLLQQVVTTACEGSVGLSAVRRAVVTRPGPIPSLARAWKDLADGALEVCDARAEYGISFAGPYEADAPGSVGRALPRVRVSLAEDDELCIAGPQVFHGYWNRPDETAHVLSGDGWMRTGDTAAIGPHERIEILASTRERITLADGRTVSPREIAATLLGHPVVAAASVRGEALDEDGERVVAQVVVREEAAFDEDEVRAYVAARLSSGKVPARIEPVDRLDRPQ